LIEHRAAYPANPVLTAPKQDLSEQNRFDVEIVVNAQKFRDILCKAIILPIKSCLKLYMSVDSLGIFQIVFGKPA
jgi:hypothetical protein